MTEQAPLNLSFDINEFTIEEMEIIEVQGETPLSQMGTALASLGTEEGSGQQVTKLLHALAYIALRRRDGEKVTWKDAGRIKFTELIDGMSGSEDDPELPPPSPAKD